VIGLTRLRWEEKTQEADRETLKYWEVLCSL